MSSMYDELAWVYDEFNKDVDHKSIAAQYDKIIKKHGVESKLTLDLGCGTGALTFELSELGYDMIGLDSSEPMLSVALEKKYELDKPEILFIQQDMVSFELFGSVGAVVSALDCVNHLLTLEDLHKLFSRIRFYLDYGGIFIFDVHSAYKMEKVFANNVFYSIADECSYVWQSNYNRESKICTHEITSFLQTEEDGLYERVDEVQKERFFTHEEILEAMEKNDLIFVECLEGFTLDEVKDDSERIIYVCKKEKGNG